ncbi:MAG: PKD domain-containing protein [Candidatus Levyibacteriota bacterium]
MKFNGRKLFLVGFIVVLLVGIPLTVYLLQQQQEVRSHAEKSTNLSFSPDSTTAAPIQKAVGDSIPLDVVVDPGKNLVDYVKLEIQYDPTVLATASADAFKVNSTAFPSVLEGPVYTPGKISVSMSVGADPTKAIQQKVTAATVTFTALNTTTAGTPTMVTFTTNTQALSSGPNDQSSENVLLNPLPAAIAIGAGAGYGSPTASTSAVPTVIATPTAGPSPTPPPPVVSPTPPPVATSTTPPVCSSLTVDRATTGAAPFSLTFTANGNASSSGTVSKVSFNFGDGQVSDVTNSGGIGTSSVNVQASHTYNSAGTYQATSLLTDSAGGVSVPSPTCSQTITVITASGSGTTGGGSNPTNPTPTMPPTGSTAIAIGAGLGALALIIGGGLIFFIL